MDTSELFSKQNRYVFLISIVLVLLQYVFKALEYVPILRSNFQLINKPDVYLFFYYLKEMVGNILLNIILVFVYIILLILLYNKLTERIKISKYIFVGGVVIVLGILQMLLFPINSSVLKFLVGILSIIRLPTTILLFLGKIIGIYSYQGLISNTTYIIFVIVNSLIWAILFNFIKWEKFWNDNKQILKDKQSTKKTTKK